MTEYKDGDIINGIYVFSEKPQPLVLPVSDDELCPHNNHIMSNCSDCDEDNTAIIEDFHCPLCSKHWNHHTPPDYIYCNNELNLIIEQYDNVGNQLTER